MKMTKLISTGLAMFAMLFGAGNIVFPLALGRDLGSMLWIGLMGFVITAVLIPLAGLISTMLCDGQYSRLLGRLGEWAGFIVALICMIIIGPFALTPRCITISHAAVKLYLPQFTIFYFSIFCAVIIYLLTRKASSVVDIIGKFLAPIKLGLLLILIVVGLLFPTAFLVTSLSTGQSFLNGLMTGYKTADLLGTIFFSGLILSNIKKNSSIQGTMSSKYLAINGLKAGMIGASLLAIMYVGFCIVAGFHGAELASVSDGDIFSILSSIVLGNIGGLFTNITVAFSCLTTAVALTTVFAKFLQNEILSGQLSYKICLLISIAITATIANLGFDQIMRIAMPFLTALYPGLIVLTFANIANILFGFRWIKTPVFITFAITLILQYWDHLQTFWATGLL
ncbi:MAG: branched-chain amino acid transport system II carrier protein [bacterium]